jgi:hypothetical protein
MPLEPSSSIKIFSRIFDVSPVNAASAYQLAFFEIELKIKIEALFMRDCNMADSKLTIGREIDAHHFRDLSRVRKR